MTVHPENPSGDNPEQPLAQTPTGKHALSPILELVGISKSFGAVVALRRVDLSVFAGEVHAVVGENGAGKSTLISIAAGVLDANAGEIRLNNAVLVETGVRAMRAKGISVANQHPALAPDLSVRENVQLAAPKIRGSELDTLLGRVATRSLAVNPDDRIETLTLAQRHVVEIVRALATRPRVLILDEPTEPFQEAEVRQLFELIGTLRDEGIAIVYISHRLNDVKQIADRISVLRDGELIDTRPAAAYSTTDIVTLIAGKPLDQVFPPKSVLPASGEPVLDVKGFGGAGFVDVDFTAHAGEIVGLTGVEGQGQREFLRGLAGVGNRQTGSIRIRGRAYTGKGVTAARAAGFGFVPDDRHVEGLFQPLSIRENLGLGLSKRIAHWGIINRNRDHAISGEIASGLGIKAASVETPVSALSGGNQQKVLIGREISAGPDVLLIDEPTHGVDIGARSEIYRQLRAVADGATPVVVASSDGMELEGLCDRVLVFSRGRVVQELSGSSVTDAAITKANLQATQLRESDVKTERKPGGHWRRRLADHLPTIAILAVTACIMAAANMMNDRFLSGFNLSILMTFVCALALIAAAQFSVMLIGEIDLSLGPLAGLVVVLSSFLLQSGQSPAAIATGTVVILLLCLLFGLMQGALVELLRLPSMVITLATFSGIQGVSLLLRPQPGGIISDLLSEAVGLPVFGVPLGMVVALVTVLALEFILSRSAFGRSWRATGSDVRASHILGVKRRRARLVAFALASLLTGCGGLVLAGQVGIGTASTGVNYTLLSITAAVLSGAKISGGRGSFVAVFAGALMVQTIMSATPFFRMSDAWQYWLIGAATLVAAGLFSVTAARSARRRIVGNLNSASA
tara:strand:- start:14329 stop:16908 length:2580 start_codon:yes stop_codon:yes gene_type:complete